MAIHGDLSMAIYQSYWVLNLSDLSESVVTQALSGIVRFCQAIWCLLILWCYLSLSCASSLPCTRSSAVPGVGVSPLRLSHTVTLCPGGDASRSKYKASDFAFSSVDTWPDAARRLRKTSPCLSAKKHYKTIPSKALKKSYEVFTCFPKHLNNHSRSQSRMILFHCFT